MTQGRTIIVFARAVLPAALLALLAGDALAGARQGEVLARRSCSICHAVSGKGLSPNKDAPAFATIARNAAFRRNGSAYILDVHPKMPNLAIATNDARDLAAYIRTLRR